MKYNNRLRLWVNRFRARRRQFAIRALGGCCSTPFCRSRRGLNFDHINPAEKIKAIGDMWTASEDKFIEELSKCQLLCAACHRKKHYPMLPAILERVERRRATRRTIEVDLMPDPVGLKETVTVGSFSMVGLESKTRWILAPSCIRTDAGLETPPALARDYLSVKYKKSPWATHKQILFLRANQPAAPLYAVPTTFRAGWYLDIVSTYWSIMQVVGWDLDYWPGKWLSAGVAPSDFPWPGHKLARNILVSAGMSSGFQIHKPGVGYMTIKTGNHLANLQLVQVIFELLNAVAAEMVAAGAVYANMDGYIFPSYASFGRGLDILNAWRLPPHVKAAGAGRVWGAGSYKFAGWKKERRDDAPYNKIAPIKHAEWLRARYTENAQERGI